MPQLVVIGYVWPEPKSSAAGRHMLSLMKCFQKNGYDIIFASPAKQTGFEHDLSAENIAAVDIELNSTTFDEWIKSIDPQVVLFDRFMMEEQFGWRVQQQCPNALRVLDTEDLQLLRFARHQAYKQNREMNQDDLFSDIAKREVAAIFRSDLSLIISDFEFHLLISQFKLNESQLLHLPFIQDPITTEHWCSYEDKKDFVTIGNFKHAPNWDCVLTLSTLWPEVRRRLPNTNMHVYGAYAPPKAVSLHNPKVGFFVHGRADSAQKVLSDARVCFAPLHFGAGIKGKFIDAMVEGTPSITTSIGHEGMSSKTDWPGLIADDNESLINAAVELYSNESLWKKAQQKIIPLLNSSFETATLENKLIQRINHQLDSLIDFRRSNFIGAMLNHHTMKSTEFMSRWIELKSKCNSQ